MFYLIFVKSDTLDHAIITSQAPCNNLGNVVLDGEFSKRNGVTRIAGGEFANTHEAVEAAISQGFSVGGPIISAVEFDLIDVPHVNTVMTRQIVEAASDVAEE